MNLEMEVEVVGDGLERLEGVEVVVLSKYTINESK